MKKIFVILSVLFVGLLVGCASKPANSSFEQKQIRPTVEVKPAQIDVDDEVWTKFSYFDMVNNLGSIPDDLRNKFIRPAVKNKFFNICNSSEISGYDFWVLIAICKWSKKDCSRSELELYGESKQWAEEFLNDAKGVQKRTLERSKEDRQRPKRDSVNYAVSMFRIKPEVSRLRIASESAGSFWSPMKSPQSSAGY